MTTTLEELKAELLRSPEVRAAYEASRPEFERNSMSIAHLSRDFGGME